MRKLESFQGMVHCIYIKLISQLALATNLALFLTFFNSLLFTREFVKEKNVNIATSVSRNIRIKL